MTKTIHTLLLSFIFLATLSHAEKATLNQDEMLLPSDLNSYQETNIKKIYKKTFYFGTSKSKHMFLDSKDHEFEIGHNLQIGYDFRPYMGIEMRYSRSRNQKKEAYKLAKELENIALYLKPIIRVTEDFSVYGLLGYGTTGIDTIKGRAVESHFQWGTGAKYALVRHVSLFADYTNFYTAKGFKRNLSQGELTLGSFNVGFNFTF